jgi:Ser/Thr protein kinase RdoA (MazF antagonist)
VSTRPQPEPTNLLTERSRTRGGPSERGCAARIGSPLAAVVLWALVPAASSTGASAVSGQSHTAESISNGDGQRGILVILRVAAVGMDRLARPSCEALTVDSQVASLRRLALRALGSYPLVDPRLRFIAHGENTTFMVDALTPTSTSHSAPPETRRFLLRIHRPRRHGRDVDAIAAIQSELAWLTALRADPDLAVPDPQAALDGRLVTAVAAEDVTEPRCCTLLRWMAGRRHTASARPVHLRRLGAAMARLHNHADGWSPPDGFVRIQWNWDTFFGDTMEYGGINAANVWNLIPTDLRRSFDEVATRVGRRMGQLGTGSDTFGLIHADLHLDNTLFAGTQARLIDFDDCGFGYRVYDVAVALWELRHRSDYTAFRDALVEGYRQDRQLTDEQLSHVDLFIAAREVAFGLWFAGTARVNPAFRDRLDRELTEIARSLDTLLRETT